MESAEIHIGIIGLGPKGFYGFERLVAELDRCDDCSAITIHLFNETENFASGWIYDPNQPEYLLMNYPNKYISCSPSNTLQPLIPIQSLSDWLSATYNLPKEQIDSQVAPRAVVGKYLQYYFERILNAARTKINIQLHTTCVTDILKETEGYKLLTQNSCCKHIHFQSLLITTGHSPAIQSCKQQKKESQCYIPFVYPLSENLNPIPPQSTVLCKGMGLTAIDAILELTEGRRGVFKKNTSGAFDYLKSGNEPALIIAYSRSGIPIVPRGDQSGTLNSTSHFLKNKIDSILNSHTRVGFERDILPWIKLDIESAYYQMLFKMYGFEYTPSDVAHFNAAKTDFHRLNLAIAPFKADELLYPEAHSNLNYANSPENYWNFWIEELNHAQSPWVAAASAWRNLSKEFNRLYQTALLTSKSRKRFQDTYFGLFNRIAYGPPIENIKKMLALHQAGILNFSFARHPSTVSTKRGWTVTLNDRKQDADFMIDARIPRKFTKSSAILFNGNSTTSLFSSPQEQDWIDLHCTIEGHPISSSGAIEKNIVLYGTPTEHILFDNDSLSRAHNDTSSAWARNTVKNVQEIKNYNLTYES